MSRNPPPFVPSEVEGQARSAGVSTSLDTNGCAYIRITFAFAGNSA